MTAKIHYAIFFCIFFALVYGCKAQSTSIQDGKKGLKDYYRKYFPIGVAVNPQTLSDPDERALIFKEFNSITPENAMKMGPIHPKEQTYNWRDADSIVNFAVRNKLRVRGHTLLWHEQTPDWIFKDKEGREVSREVLLQRLKEHIYTVVGRYKGKIYAWDVVNEVIDDNPNNFLRKSKWLDIIGEDFIAKAFQYAHEADPNALLFYNDYNTERPSKRDKIFKLLKQLLEAKVPINGIGLQSHWSIFEPSEKDLRASIEAYASLGLQLHFTEVDMSVYPWEKDKRKKRDGETDALSAEQESKQAMQYAMAFRLFREYRKSITSVTFWNVSDRYTWLDLYPVEGRKNYPLLFDKDLKRKKVYNEVVNF
ncbi:endo-1,4-beta-xylanase [Pedobacter sp. MC2016-14]|uniref:endo-1,4-beta-xylanase n=1 Tax=Pedobacter sp. MC2016-14 TaxID=2897327 RepID=UPI001E41D179|nr:endo-1,4-beta-xylanase [Pedobacter sp. MC2016-14]MCD0489169.1 endo-1,4-beta-xylanase [Pedobacter sp. MC2016-14]